jgi:hypothetical protein
MAFNAVVYFVLITKPDTTNEFARIKKTSDLEIFIFLNLINGMKIRPAKADLIQAINTGLAGISLIKSPPVLHISAVRASINTPFV